jgi:hypothetical protein
MHGMMMVVVPFLLRRLLDRGSFDLQWMRIIQVSGMKLTGKGCVCASWPSLSNGGLGTLVMTLPQGHHVAPACYKRYLHLMDDPQGVSEALMR